MPKIVYYRGWTQTCLPVELRDGAASVAADAALQAIIAGCNCCANRALDGLCASDQQAVAEWIISQDDALDGFLTISPCGVTITGLKKARCKRCMNMKKNVSPAAGKASSDNSTALESRTWSDADIYNHLLSSIKAADGAVAVAQPISLFFLAALPSPNEGPVTAAELARTLDMPTAEISKIVRRLVANGRVDQFSQTGKRDRLYRLGANGYSEVKELMPWLLDLEPLKLMQMREALHELMPNLGFVSLAIMAAVATDIDNVRDICHAIGRDFRQTKMSVILRDYPFLDRIELGTVSKITKAVCHKYKLNPLSQRILALVSGK